jgi:DNA polymerase I-like protein with 3'-5' exonuclease and polymerase domains
MPALLMHPTTYQRRTIGCTFDGGELGKVDVPVTYVITPDDLAWCCERLAAEREVGLDLETGGLNRRKHRIATLQVGNAFSKDPWIAVVDVRAFTPEQLQPLFALLMDPRRLKVVHNGKFEASWLLHHYDVYLQGLYDTQVVEQVLRAGLLTHPKALEAGADIVKGESAQTMLRVRDRKKRGAAKQKGGDNDESKKALVPVSMARMMARYGRVSIEKWTDLRVSFDKTPVGQHSDRQLEYAAGDVVYPFMLRERQRPLIQERGLGHIVRVEMRLLPVLAEAEVSGMGFDTAGWLALADEAEAEQRVVQAELDALAAPFSVQGDLFGGGGERPINPFTNEPWNYDGSEQVKDFIGLYCESINWPVELVFTEARVLELQKQHGAEWLDQTNSWIRQKAARAGRKPILRSWSHVPLWVIPEQQHYLMLTTDHKNLTVGLVRGLLPKELIVPLVRYAKLSQRVTTYGRKYLKHVEQDRMYFDFNQNLAATGRLSSSPNSMAIPRDKRYRACFRPRRGYKYCIADLSQIEPRLIAQVSGDETYRTTFNTTGKIYEAVGEEVYGVPIDKHDPRGALLRQSAKVMVLSLSYKMGSPKYRMQYTLAMADDILAGKAQDLSLDEAKSNHARFFEVCPGIKDYQDHCIAQVDFDNPEANLLYDDLVGETVAYIKAPCGRIRFWTKDMNRFTEPTNCVDEETEILTKRGWLKYFQLCDQDEVLAKDPESGALVWSPLLHVTVRKHTGRMVHLRNKTFDALVTPEHRWLVHNNRTGHDYMTTTDALNRGGAEAIHRTGNYTGDARVADDLLYVIAWVLTDGSLKRSRVGEKRQVYIHQSERANASKVALIDALFSRNPTWLTSRRLIENTKAVIWYLSPEGRDLVMRWVTNTREPNWELLAQMSGVQAQAMLEVANMADGSGTTFEPRHTPKIFVRSHELASWWAAVAVLAGWATTVQVTKARVSTSVRFGFTAHSKPGLKVSFLRRPTFQPVEKFRTDVEVEDKLVWCPTTSTGTWVARRKGKVFVTGNCPIQSAGATGTKIACVLLSEHIRREGWDARIVNIIHDEIVVECEDAHAEACALALKSCMEQGCAAFMPDVPVVAEFPESAPNGVADCWTK